jgi:hypothetical protein
MTAIRRTALRVLVSIVATVSVGLIGASTAAAATTPGDVVWSTPNDVVW